MIRKFKETFGAGKTCIGVIHLAPLPGSPNFGGDLSAVVDRAVREADLLVRAGFDGLIVENYGDVPFLKTDIGAETIAAMTVVTHEIRDAINIPVGVNVLRNDYRAALAVAGACRCEFIRLNVLVGAFVTPEGIIEGSPGEVLRMRRRIAPAVMLLADVKVKHALPLAATTIGEDALDNVERGEADCLIITGARTGSPPSAEELKAARRKLDAAGRQTPILVGSGITPSNAIDFLKLSDGFIVGSYIRKHGRAGEEIELDKAREIGSIKNKSEE